MEIRIIGSLILDVIQLCNLNCDMCLRGENTGKRITRKVVEKIFDEIKYVNEIVFSGGEVTLAYNEIKMILDVIKEKKVIVETYQIVVNGTIYNKKLFDLLKDNFKSGTIGISCDYYHDKSIKEKYPDKLDKIMENTIKITKERDFKHFIELPPILLNQGNAVNLDVPKEEPNIIGFVSTIRKKKYLCVGPEITIDVDGNLTGGNNTYEINDNNHFGNIFNTPLSKLIIENSIRRMFFNKNDFINYIEKLEDKYFYIKGSKGYVIRNKKIKREKRKVINIEKLNNSINDNSKRLILEYQSDKKS